MKHKRVSSKVIGELRFFRPRIRSRHPSHAVLRRELRLLPFKSVVRLGSQTVLGDEISVGGQRVELNLPEAVRTSANKLLMKQAFINSGVKTASCWVWLEGHSMLRGIVKEGVAPVENTDVYPEELPYPIVAKHIFGSRGTGNTLISSLEELRAWMRDKTMSNYICEKFHNYNREYRLHVTKDGCFYTCRKVLREETPKSDRWYRNDSNCNWLVEQNDQFDRPVNWNQIEEECVKALRATGLDFGACDVKAQSAIDSKGRTRENPEFIVIEINSAPSFGEGTTQRYLKVIPELLKEKFISQF
jgi:carbamoylphosphate synthase large subunit